MASSLILVANPGSASRKYALYDTQLVERARLHFELSEGAIACTLLQNGELQPVNVEVGSLDTAASYVEAIFIDKGVLAEDESIDAIGLRIVAPSSFFMQHHIIDDEVIQALRAAEDSAPLHVAATLAELTFLKGHFSEATVVGVSDSAFHASKPSYAWNYGINIQDADRFDIKRFGYHGLSIQGTLSALDQADRITPKIVVCHLGSGSSVTAVANGRSLDTTMGYTPLEGLIMATRSGSIDAGAVRALKTSLGLDEEGMEDYLHNHGGLLGLGGSNDIRELIERETNGDHLAHLALDTLVHSIQKAIGSMAAALNGADQLIFTGTVGERSAILRKRIVAKLGFMDFVIDGEKNQECTNPTQLTRISQDTASKPIVVIPTDESHHIAEATRQLLADQLDSDGTFGDNSY